MKLRVLTISILILLVQKINAITDSSEVEKLQAIQEEPVHNTFSSTRIANGHAIEMLKWRELDVRIFHRFGTVATPASARSLFGLDQSDDIRIGFEYGVRDKFNIGFGRSKGAGPQREIWDGYLKYKLLQQTNYSGKPVSITALYSYTYTSMRASSDPTSSVSFDDGDFLQRTSYALQLHIARKFSERFSLQLSPTYVHRNYVAFEDQNGLFATGVSGIIRLNKAVALLGEYYMLFPSSREVLGITYRNPLTIGAEFNTGGHIFHLNFTNSSGLGETQFIPHTRGKWLDGEFRFGFTISRIFKL